MELSDLIHSLSKGKDYTITVADAEDSPCIVKGWLSTDCLALDVILGGGLPIGRIVEIYGGTSTGKSLIAAQCVASAQAQGYVVLYIDAERAVSLDIMRQVGVDTSKLMYADPETIEQVFELMEEIVLKHKSETPLLIVWDSVAATTNKAEQEAEYGKAVMGKHAQLISQGLRKFNHLISKHDVVVLFINQIRKKIGVMFGDDETTFGGEAIGFYASVRIRLKNGPKLKQATKVIGINTTAHIVKSKVSEPFGEATLPIYFGYGIDDAGAALHYLKDHDMIESGSWSKIVINGTEHKFQSSGWPELFDANYDAIVKIMSENNHD